MPTPDRYPDFARELRSLRSRVSELERAQLNRANVAGYLDPAITVITGGAVTLASTPTATALSFTGVEVDTVEAFSLGTPDQITAQRAGVYFLHGLALFEPTGSTTGRRSLELIATDSSGVRISGFIVPPASGDSLELSPTGVFLLGEGDTVKLIASQTSGSGGLDVQSGRLSAVWLGVPPA
jgi:hypothetical protein